MILDEESLITDLLDTAGDEEYPALRKQWIRDCEGFMIVYSITSRPSFEQCLRFVNEAKRKGYVDLPKTIVDDIIVLLLCANRYDSNSRVSEIDINVWRMILRFVFASRMDRELWEPLIDRQRKKQSSATKKKKCVVQ